MFELNFSTFAYSSLGLWLVGGILFSLKNNKLVTVGKSMQWSGVAVLAVFIALLWIELERPPMRTLGETRLWYAMFLSVISLVVFQFKKYKWFVLYGTGMASLFTILNLVHPEYFNKALMPALQSVWFVPHVIVYIFSYALLAASSLVALNTLYTMYFKKNKTQTLELADDLVKVGFGFLTLGLIFGALWAKEAWGNYWTWDPKETWAFLTWIGYLIYIHYRKQYREKAKTHAWILALAFVVLLICWFGVNYLPSAANSVHTYGAGQ